MLNSARIYSLGISTGVGMALTLLAVAARLGIISPNALLGIGCLVSGICLLLVGNAMWFRHKHSDTHGN